MNTRNTNKTWKINRNKDCVTWSHTVHIRRHPQRECTVNKQTQSPYPNLCESVWCGSHNAATVCLSRASVPPFNHQQPSNHGSSISRKSVASRSRRSKRHHFWTPLSYQEQLKFRIKGKYLFDRSNSKFSIQLIERKMPSQRSFWILASTTNCPWSEPDMCFPETIQFLCLAKVNHDSSWQTSLIRIREQLMCERYITTGSTTAITDVREEVLISHRTSPSCCLPRAIGLHLCSREEKNRESQEKKAKGKGWLCLGKDLFSLSKFLAPLKPWLCE